MALSIKPIKLPLNGIAIITYLLIFTLIISFLLTGPDVYAKYSRMLMQQLYSLAIFFLVFIASYNGMSVEKFKKFEDKMLNISTIVFFFLITVVSYFM